MSQAVRNDLLEGVLWIRTFRYENKMQHTDSHLL